MGLSTLMLSIAFESQIIGALMLYGLTVPAGMLIKAPKRPPIIATLN